MFTVRDMRSTILVNRPYFLFNMYKLCLVLDITYQYLLVNSQASLESLEREILKFRARQQQAARRRRNYSLGKLLSLYCKKYGRWLQVLTLRNVQKRNDCLTGTRCSRFCVSLTFCRNPSKNLNYIVCIMGNFSLLSLDKIYHSMLIHVYQRLFRHNGFITNDNFYLKFKL